MSDYLDPNNEELLKDFFSEAQGQVDTLEQNILVLENDPNNKDSVDEIFRAAHTLKGGSATVQMMELQGFTHLIEDVLDEIRSDRLPVTEEVVDVLLKAIDVVKAMLEARMGGSVYAEDPVAVKNALSALIPAEKPKTKAAAKPPAPRLADLQSAPKPASAPAAASQAVSSAGLTEYEILELKEAAGKDRRVYRVTIMFDESNVMKTISAIHAFAAMRDAGTVLKTHPDFEQLYEDQFFPEVDYYVATERSAEELERKTHIPEVTTGARVTELVFDDSATPTPVNSAKPVSPAAVSEEELAQAMARKNAAPTQQAAPVAAVSSAPATPSEGSAEHGGEGEDGEHKAVAGPKVQQGSILRVDSKRIDNLLNLVSETVINKATFNQISSQFSELQGAFLAGQSEYQDKLKDLFDEVNDALASGKTVKEVKKDLQERAAVLGASFDTFEADFKTTVAKFRSTAQNLGRITGELQEGVMRIRMVPISQIFSRFPRLVRDLCKSLDKKVELIIEGEETELDKSVVEDLLDPLMHSVRNALDHGVESPEVRRAAGKPEQGTVWLRASNEGNMIIIEIEDDGKGIDVEAVKRKAVERGIIHPNKILTEVEAFNLIFEAGFSTADKVTNISGRGVGLDVVRRKIQKLNGSVTVTSKPGKGSKFTIKLPLTLAIIQGLLVRVGRETYSIPITSVIESHRIKPSEIRMIDNYEVFNVRNDVVSLLRLDRLFRIPSSEQREYNFIVIVGTNEKRVGLMVDSLIGEEDVVIKPLHDQYTSSPGIAGASILGDGSVCLIIDVSQLLELGLKREKEERARLEGTIR
jgi:two-component system, chemotaxis family, sensor kinase CheA